MPLTAAEHVHRHPEDEAGYTRLAAELKRQGDPSGALIELWPQVEVLNDLQRRSTALLAERDFAILGDLVRYQQTRPSSLSVRWRAGFVERARIDGLDQATIVAALLASPAGALLREVELAYTTGAPPCFPILARAAPLLRRVAIGNSVEYVGVHGGGPSIGTTSLAGLDAIAGLRSLSVSGTTIAFEEARLAGVESLEISASDGIEHTVNSLISIPRPSLRTLWMSARYLTVEHAQRIASSASLPALRQVHLMSVSPAAVEAFRAASKHDVTALEQQPSPFRPHPESQSLPPSRGAGDAASGAKRSAALEAKLRASPDDLATYLGYAAWLDGEGDPRGELIRVQVAMLELDEVARSSAAAMHAAREHLDRIIGHHIDVRWRRGLIHRAALVIPPAKEALAALWSKPSGQFVRELVLRHSNGRPLYSYHEALAAIGEHATPSLRELTIEEPGAEDFSELAKVRDRCPNLQKLRLRGHISSPDLHALAGRWPSLTHLDLDFTGTPFGRSTAPAARDMRAWLSSSSLPALIALAIDHTAFDEEIIEILGASGLLGKLESLVIGGCLSSRAEPRLRAALPSAATVVVHDYPRPKKRAPTLGPVFTSAKNNYYSVGSPRRVTSAAELAPHERDALLHTSGKKTPAAAIAKADERHVTFWPLTLLDGGAEYVACTYHLGDTVVGFLLRGEKLVHEISDGTFVRPRRKR